MEAVISWNQASKMLIKSEADLLFIGIYDTERYEPVSVWSADSVRNPDGSSDKDPIIMITPTQVRAMYSHIKYGKSLMVGIDIADLNFVCIRKGNDGVAGMSNFNMERKEIKHADKLLFSLTREHYTRQDSLEGVHALSIAGLLRDDVLVIGISKSSNVSVSELLGDLIMLKDGKLVLKSEKDSKITTGLENSRTVDDNVHGIQRQEEITTEKGFVFEDLDSDLSDEEKPPIRQNKPLREEARVKMRASTKSEVEKKQDQLKRQTSFCEDWRTATIRSIEALQGIGPFGSEQVNTDTEPLLDDMAVYIAQCKQGDDPEPEVKIRTPEVRRESRVTDV